MTDNRIAQIPVFIRYICDEIKNPILDSSPSLHLQHAIQYSIEELISALNNRTANTNTLVVALERIAAAYEIDQSTWVTPSDQEKEEWKIRMTELSTGLITAVMTAAMYFSSNIVQTDEEINVD